MSVLATHVFAGASMERHGPAEITFANGRIGAITAMPADNGAPRRLVMPALANAHDHARPLSPTSFGAANKPLETWLLRLGAMPAVDPYLAAAASLGRAARAGCASVMAHYTRALGPMSVPEEAAMVARAAKDIGIRVTFAMFMRDQNPLVYGPSEETLSAMPADVRREVESVFCNPMPRPREQVARVEAIAEAAEGDLCTVQFGPNGPQWCTDALLEAIADASERSGRRIHMHLLETRYQRAWADRHFPDGIVRHLKEIGILSPRLTLAHCVWANDEDLALIAEAGAVIATNASSNLHLRSGIAPISKALKHGCRVAIGVDGSALDEDDDAIRELRMAHFLHAGWGYDEVVAREPFLNGVVGNGRFANGAPGTGLIEVGAEADLLVLDLDKLDRDRIMPVDPMDFVFARANASHVAELIVAGKTIVRDGRLTGIDLDAVQEELRAMYRSRMAGKASFHAAWPQMEPAIAAFYRDRMGCC
jgi:cytosine/adenosine deaminase-related metal-dependent hydrolase